MHQMSLQEDGGLHKSLYTLPVIVLLTAVAFSFVRLGFVMPLRTLYAREIGASSVEVGLMATSFLLASFAVTPAIGWLSDRVGYRNILGLSLLTYAWLLAVYVPVTSPGTLIALRALEGVSAAGVLTPARALMNTLTPPDRYGEALGLVPTGRTVWILAGPAVGTLLASGVGYTPAFLAASGVLTLTALAVFIMLRPHADVTPKAAAHAPVFSNGFTRPLALAYGLAVVLAWPQGVTPAIWSLYMQDRGRRYRSSGCRSPPLPWRRRRWPDWPGGSLTGTAAGGRFLLVWCSRESSTVSTAYASHLGGSLSSR
jgi:MFS family permease